MWLKCVDDAHTVALKYGDIRANFHQNGCVDCT